MAPGQWGCQPLLHGLLGQLKAHYATLKSPERGAERGCWIKVPSDAPSPDPTLQNLVSRTVHPTAAGRDTETRAEQESRKALCSQSGAPLWSSSKYLMTWVHGLWKTADLRHLMASRGCDPYPYNVPSDGLQIAGYPSMLQRCTHKHAEVYRHTKINRGSMNGVQLGCVTAGTTEKKVASTVLQNLTQTHTQKECRGGRRKHNLGQKPEPWRHIFLQSPGTEGHAVQPC